MKKSRSSNKLIIANFSTKFGTIIFITSSLLWAAIHFQSAQVIGLISAFSFIPNILFSLFGGAIGDAYSRKKILLVSDIFSIIVCIFSVVFITINLEQSLKIIIICTFALNSINTFFSPASKGYAKEVVEIEELVKFNGKLATTTEVARIVAPLFSSIVITLFNDIRIVLIINAVSYLISFILIYSINESIGISNKVDESSSIKVHVKKFMYYLIDVKEVILLLVLLSMYNFFSTLIDVNLPYYSEIVLKNPNIYTYLLTVQSIGSVTAGITLRKKKYNDFSLIIDLVASIAFFPLVYFTSKLYILFISIYFYGLFLVRFNVKLYSYIQLNIDEKYVSSTFSLLMVFSSLLMPLSSYVFAIYGETYSKSIFLISTVGISFMVILYVVTMIFFKRKSK